MSGSGGFFRYRCKYFYTHNCPNWVYVNNTPCANCCAEGREIESTAASQAPAWGLANEICVPQAEDGILYYTLMEIVNTEAGSYWMVRYKVNQPSQVPTVTTTGATPGAPIIAHRY